MALATRNAAAILGWEGKLGVIAKDALADLLVIAGHAGDPYAALLRAGEQDIRAVLIGGQRPLRHPGAADRARRDHHRADRASAAAPGRSTSTDPTSNPQVAALTLAAARAKLRDALGAAARARARPGTGRGRIR